MSPSWAAASSPTAAQTQHHLHSCIRAATLPVCHALGLQRVRILSFRADCHRTRISNYVSIFASDARIHGVELRLHEEYAPFGLSKTKRNSVCCHHYPRTLSIGINNGHWEDIHSWGIGSVTGCMDKIKLRHRKKPKPKASVFNSPIFQLPAGLTSSFHASECKRALPQSIRCLMCWIIGERQTLIGWTRQLLSKGRRPVTTLDDACPARKTQQKATRTTLMAILPH
ncbi:hypothetical protein BT63DRAFT_476470 [Microthyrium microscopicum]|uniref:Uncharacterized protein n=1 Tax=Microthyrium microscopicum TaxID=703497 RepID=A0A6A6UH52_9PEZI|nr:hypothetical protein BT63DRAFT_476470 [Microthyrium microscopicum]